MTIQHSLWDSILGWLLVFLNYLYSIFFSWNEKITVRQMVWMDYLQTQWTHYISNISSHTTYIWVIPCLSLAVMVVRTAWFASHHKWFWFWSAAMASLWYQEPQEEHMALYHSSSSPPPCTVPYPQSVSTSIHKSKKLHHFKYWPEVLKIWMSESLFSIESEVRVVGAESGN